MRDKRKIALVTGGSRGLGKDMALQLAKKGIDVILTYRSKKHEAEEVAEQIKAEGMNATALQLDTSKISEFEDFIRSLSFVLKSDFNSEKIDFLINNAGIGWNAAIGEATEEQFDTLINIHFKGPLFLTQVILPLLNDGGGIVNISSGLTRKTLPGPSIYAAAKGAMEILTRYQAKELGSRGIRSNIVAPGAIATDFNGGAVRDKPEYNKMVASMIPLGRVGEAHDIGGVVAFLCSDDAKWVNGERIEVSGGQTL